MNEEMLFSEWERYTRLAHEPDILACFIHELNRLGVVGDPQTFKLIYLTLVSRLLDKPVCLAVKGAYSAGKSYAVEQTLRFFPEAAYNAMTGMSEKALVYGTEALSHRIIVIYEACGVQGKTGAYLLRSLISEGRICHMTTVQRGGRPVAVRIVREGPVGLIITTTETAMVADNETRMLSLTMRDDPAYIQAVMEAQGKKYAGVVDPDNCDWQIWHRLQDELGAEKRRVVIPYAQAVTAQIPPIALRLNRDVPLLMSLVCAHALLHRASRETDHQGRIVADWADYDKVRGWVTDLMETNVAARVSDAMRATVEAVRDLTQTTVQPTTTGAVAARLGIDKAATSRRIQQALKNEWIIDSSRFRNTSRLTVGEPLPGERQLLPTADSLRWIEKRAA